MKKDSKISDALAEFRVSLNRPKSARSRLLKAAKAISRAAKVSISDIEKARTAFKKIRFGDSAPDWCKKLARETIFSLAHVKAVAEEWDFDEELTRAALRCEASGCACDSDGTVHMESLCHLSDLSE